VGDGGPGFLVGKSFKGLDRHERDGKVLGKDVRCNPKEFHQRQLLVLASLLNSPAFTINSRGKFGGKLGQESQERSA
jgi:hypothetical protein